MAMWVMSVLRQVCRHSMYFLWWWRWLFDASGGYFSVGGAGSRVVLMVLFSHPLTPFSLS